MMVSVGNRASAHSFWCRGAAPL